MRKYMLIIIFFLILINANASNSIIDYFEKMPDLNSNNLVSYPKYCIEKKNNIINPCYPCDKSKGAKFESIIDDKNGFLQIFDYCPSALDTGFRTQLAIFKTIKNEIFILNSVWLLSPGYGNQYYLRAYRYEKERLIAIDLKSIFPKISDLDCMSESYNKNELDTLKNGFIRSDLDYKLHKSEPFFAFTLPREGTDIFIDIDMNVWFRGTDPQLKKINTLQYNFLNHRKYLIRLNWDVYNGRFIIGEKILRKSIPNAIVH